MLKPEYVLVRRAVKVLKSCTLPEQKIMALEYAKRAIEFEIKPLTNKQKDIITCEIEKDTIYKFLCSLAGENLTQTDFLEDAH